MYHKDGLKILNLDRRGLGQDRESEGGARFSRGREMWKASSEAGCSLNVPSEMLHRSEVVCCLFYLHVASKLAISVCLYNFFVLHY